MISVAACGPNAPACYMAWNVSGAAIGGYMATGSWSAAYTSAVMATASGGMAAAVGGAFKPLGENFSIVLAKAITHAVTQGVLAHAFGGRFKDAALGAFMGTYGELAPKGVSGLMVSVVLGGTASRIGGGKFANGAITAAFVYMFNGMGHGDGDEKADLTLSEEEEATILKMVDETSHDPTSPTEAYRLLHRSGKKGPLQTEDCTETTCPGWAGVTAEVHWHVNASNPPEGVSQASANLAREFPGRGDHGLMDHDVINVGVTPKGAVWAIERVGGRATLRYLRNSSNPALDNFVRQKWYPGMNERKMLNALEGFK